MQYTTEDLSAVKKKISVTVPAEEVDAAILSTIAMYRTSVTFDGFRKGKVPSSIIEKRFHKEISQEATTELVNVHINEIIGETKLNPVSRIDFDGKDMKKGEAFTYSISFEVLPEFEVPNYEGFAVEQEETVVNEDEIDSVIDRLRSNMSEIITVGEKRLPKAGDIAVIDFAAFDESGALIGGIKADDFQMSIGEGQTIVDFENLVCSLHVGEENQGPVKFPDDFFNPEFAGKTVSMKVKVQGLKERKLPEVDTAFAQKAGGFESVEKLRDSVRQSYMKSRDDLNKSEAQKKLLDGLLKLTEFPLPDSMVESNLNALVEDLREKLDRQGKDWSFLGKTEESIKDELRPEAEMRARSQIFLVGVARKQEIAVTEQEVDTQIHRMAIQSSQDPSTVKDYYVKNNLIFALRDRILADKAMDAIYAKAVVTKVPPKKSEQTEK